MPFGRKESFCPFLSDMPRVIFWAFGALGNVFVKWMGRRDDFVRGLSWEAWPERRLFCSTD